MQINKIVIAPDSYKGSLDAIDVTKAIAEGIHKFSPLIETVELPIADGGEGTLDVLLYAMKGEKISCTVSDPLGRDIETYYGIVDDGKKAIVEMAKASGLPLVGNEKNPLKTTTFGTGQLIRDALDKGCREFIIGIGGSATNDGGIGMAAALGVRFIDFEGNEVSLNGQGLSEIEKIDMSDLDPRVKESEFVVACDVDNPLYGVNGAAYVYAPQKGADEAMVRILDNNLKHYAEVIENQLNIDVQNIPGSGAAGGLGAGFVTFLNANLESGIEIALNLYKFDEMIKDTDIVITGEGRIDSQSLRGKVLFGIARRCKSQGIPTIALVGEIGNGFEPILDMGITSVFTINTKAMDYEVSRHHSRENLEIVSEQIIRLLSI